MRISKVSYEQIEHKKLSYLKKSKAKKNKKIIKKAKKLTTLQDKLSRITGFENFHIINFRE